ncbi:MAG: PfkB family carbohydrate kinase [Paraglaciecola sp.]|nr:PfkB family carbohydrate kinase [Paraglaciecola sp.]
MKKVVCIGEMLIDFVYVDTNAGLSKGSNFIKKPSGAPANVAALGNEPFGTYLKNEVVDYHVNTDFVETVDMPTTLAAVSLAYDGEREFAFNRGDDEHLTLSDIAMATLLNNAICQLVLFTTQKRSSFSSYLHKY